MNENLQADIDFRNPYKETTMRFRIHPWLCILAALFLASCDVHVSGGAPKNTGAAGSSPPVSGRPGHYTGAGVTFLTRLESANATYGTAGINYESKTLKAATDGKTLIVNGKSFGEVQSGDIVDFTESGIVKVNGTVRRPSAQDR